MPHTLAPIESPSIDTRATLATARDYMARQRWSAAAALFERLPQRDASTHFQYNICRNLAAMQQHRPAIYEAIMSAREPERYTVGTAACGHPTIIYRADDGSRLSLSPGNQPVAALSQTFAS